MISLKTSGTASGLKRKLSPSGEASVGAQSLSARRPIAPPKTPAARLLAPAAQGAWGEWGSVRGKGGGRDTDDGRTDLAHGLSLSPSSGFRGVYPKRGWTDL